MSKFVEGIGAHSTPRQVLVHKVTADGFKTGRKKNPKKQDSQKKDPKSKKEPAEAKDVPKRKKEPAEAQNVASKGGGRVVGQGKVEGVANAYEIAKAGGRHHGTYDNYAKRSTRELEKSIRNYQSRRKGSIEVRRDKIANPKKYDPNWDTYTKQHQKNQLKNWQQEVDNAGDKIRIIQGILKERES